MPTTTEAEDAPMRLTDEAKALADAQPIIDVAEVNPDPAPTVGVAVERASQPEPPALIPHTDELTVLAQLAVTFAQAGLVPKPLKGKPADVLLVLMTGRGLGIDPLVALRECHPIDGKVTVSPKLKLAIVRQRGLGQVWPDPGNDGEHATWHATRTDDPRETVYSASYSMEDARAAKLAGKDNWKMYPRQMLQWRALGYLLDIAFGEVGTGLYSADELGAVTDDEGRAVIDVTEVTPLAGIEPKVDREAERQAAESALCSDEDRQAIKAKIDRLPPPAVPVLLELWRKPTDEKMADGTPVPTLWPLKALPVRQVKVAHALVDSVTARALRGEWGEWTGGEAAAASEAPVAEPDADDDEVCTDPGCVDLAVILDDEANPWCDRHAPAELLAPEGDPDAR